MKIVNRQQFLDLPSGTLFREYEPCFFGQLSVKGETLRGRLQDGTCTDDFSVMHLDSVDAKGEHESIQALYDAAEKGTSFNFDYDGWMRNGWDLESNGKMYAVYEQGDVRRLVEVLQRICLKP